MATHSSVLAWRIPGTVKSGGLPSMGSHRVGHDWSDAAAASSWNDCGTTWFFSSCGGIFELPQGIHASSYVGPQKSYLPFEIRGRAGGAL